MVGQDLQKAAELLAAARSIAALTGAGVSAESGVPTFRGAGGLWKNFPVEEVATPEAFQRNPQFVWEFYNHRRNALANIKPNPAHRALAELESAHQPFTIITQNIDGLHQAAGSRHVIEVHGNLWNVRCTRCGITRGRTGEQLPAMPSCDSCGALVRPDVVWFGESLPADRWEAAERAATECDCMLVVGTSAYVQPAASLAWFARRAGADVIEINLEPTPAGQIASVKLYGKAGEILPPLIDLRAQICRERN